MNVRCTSCQTVYRVDPAKVPEAGVRARCATCNATIVVSRDGAGTASTAGPAPAPTRAAPGAPVGGPAAAPPPTPREPSAPVAPPPASAPAARPAPRLSQPFFQPRAPQPEQAVAPQRPSAPVFRPTPGKPMTAPPAAPPAAAEQPVAEAAAPAPPAEPVPDITPKLEPPARRTSISDEVTEVQPAITIPPAEPSAAEVPAGQPKKPINPFLQRDPKQKARRLARALVSDMIVYQPEKRQQALAAGVLKDEFSEEIQKSWEEYVEQIGEELATSTDYWTEALNDILAGGQKIF